MSDRGRPEWAFNLHDDPRGIVRQLADGLQATVFAGDNLMVSIVRIEPHSRGEVHSHPEEQWGFLLEGECTRVQSGEEFEAKEGDFWQTPGNVRHGIRTGDTGAVVLDVFSPPREEYRKSGSGFAGRSAKEGKTD